jgi:hypothetical protein
LFQNSRAGSVSLSLYLTCRNTHLSVLLGGGAMSKSLFVGVKRPLLTVGLSPFYPEKTAQTTLVTHSHSALWP